MKFFWFLCAFFLWTKNVYQPSTNQATEPSNQPTNPPLLLCINLLDSRFIFVTYGDKFYFTQLCYLGLKVFLVLCGLTFYISKNTLFLLSFGFDWYVVRMVGIWWCEQCTHLKFSVKHLFRSFSIWFGYWDWE